MFLKNQKIMKRKMLIGPETGYPVPSRLTHNVRLRRDRKAWPTSAGEARALQVLDCCQYSLPRQQPATDTGRPAWNIGPEDRHPWTGLDDLTMVTDLRVSPRRDER